MGQVAAALKSLEPDAVRRVLKWALERYQPRQGGSGTGTPVEAGAMVPETATAAASLPRTFLNLPELFDAAEPETGTDKVLVTAYWFQNFQAPGLEWGSQTINTELKHLGHPSSNITRDLDNLMARKPKLVLQTRKEGTKQQGRRRYKLTREGTRAVETMLSRLKE